MALTITMEADQFMGDWFLSRRRGPRILLLVRLLRLLPPVTCRRTAAEAGVSAGMIGPWALLAPAAFCPLSTWPTQ